MTTLDRALYYKNTLKISVVPQRNKAPLVPWVEFQSRLPTDDELKRWFDKYPDAGIAGIVGSVSGVVVIDCDSQEAINSFEESLPEGTITPCSKTPRGGRHYYFRCTDKLQKQVGFMDKVDFQAEGSCIVMPPSVGMNGVSYEWLIEPLDVTDFPLLSSLPISSSFSPYNAPHKIDRYEQGKDTFFTFHHRDEDLFHVANSLVKGGCNPAMMQWVLERLTEVCDPPEDHSKAIIKIKSALDRAGRKERDLAKEIDDYIDMATGTFLTTELNSSLQITLPHEKKNVNVILHRLWKKSVIEKTGLRNGSWRRVESECETIDWRAADTTDYPIKFPLGIEELASIYPSNVLILAGVQNAGKTSFCLETIRLNMKTHPVYYFSCEGGAKELKKRITDYHPDMAVPDDWVFTAKDRSHNFADVIVPTALNIIDFIEIYDEFYKMGGWISEIHSKLTTGIALICIQKKSSTKKEQQDFGRGGEMTAEKPRLYLAMDRGKIKIVKAKIWKSHEINPNGLIREFNIIGGYKWLPKGDWYHEGGSDDKDFPREH